MFAFFSLFIFQECIEEEVINAIKCFGRAHHKKNSLRKKKLVALDESDDAVTS